MTTVLYIAGVGRSGSTLIARAIGAADGAVGVGEVRQIWTRGFAEDRLCGCGQPFSACEFWRAVREAAGLEGPDVAASMESAVMAATRIRHLPALLRGGRRPHLDGEPARTLAALYRAIAQVGGADVVVDSSKLPTYGAVVDALPDLDVRILHVVRDPRATAHSWSRAKRLDDGAPRSVMEQRPSAKTALLWTLWNSVVARWWAGSGRYARLRYEDFVAAPADALRTALDQLGLGELHPPIDGACVHLGVEHTVAGNPDRLRTGDVTITEDDRWRRQEGAVDRTVVSVLTAPVLHNFGYEVRSPR